MSELEVAINILNGRVSVQWGEHRTGEYLFGEIFDAAAAAAIFEIMEEPTHPSILTFKRRSDELAAKLPHFRRCLFEDAIGPAAQERAQLCAAAKAAAGCPALVIRADDAASLALPWDLLLYGDAQDGTGRSFASVRRELYESEALPITMIEADRLGVLSLTARPNGSYDVGLHDIARPIRETLDSSFARMLSVRPPTFSGLNEWVEDARVSRHAADIFVFDGHGRLVEIDGSLKGVIFLESQGFPGYSRIDAATLAKCLVALGVRLCILNACETGSTGRRAARADSLFALDLSHGARIPVVAMATRVTPRAAALFTSKMLSAFSTGARLDHAIEAGRTALKAAADDVEIGPGGWLIPVLYGAGQLQWKRRAADKTAARSVSELPSYFRRDDEFARLERTLSERPMTLVEGMGGVGKTAFIQAFGRNWADTGGSNGQDTEFIYIEADPADGPAAVRDRVAGVLAKKYLRDRFVVVDGLRAVHFSSESEIFDWLATLDRIVGAWPGDRLVLACTGQWAREVDSELAGRIVEVLGVSESEALRFLRGRLSEARRKLLDSVHMTELLLFSGSTPGGLFALAEGLAAFTPEQLVEDARGGGNWLHGASRPASDVRSVTECAAMLLGSLSTAELESIFALRELRTAASATLLAHAEIGRDGADSAFHEIEAAWIDRLLALSRVGLASRVSRETFRLHPGLAPILDRMQLENARLGRPPAHDIRLMLGATLRIIAYEYVDRIDTEAPAIPRSRTEAFARLCPSGDVKRFLLGPQFFRSAALRSSAPAIGRAIQLSCHEGRWDIVKQIVEPVIDISLTDGAGELARYWINWIRSSLDKLSLPLSPEAESVKGFLSDQQRCADAIRVGDAQPLIDMRVSIAEHEFNSGTSRPSTLAHRLFGSAELAAARMDIEGAQNLARRARALFDGAGQSENAALMDLFQLSLDALQGRLFARDQFDALYRSLANSVGDVRHSANVIALGLLIEWRDFRRAREVFAALDTTTRGREVTRSSMGLFVKSLCDYALGEGSGSMRQIRKQIALLNDEGIETVIRSPLLLLGADVALGMNEPDLAIDLLSQIGSQGRSIGLPHMRAVVHGALAQAYAAAGRKDEARAEILGAMDLSSALPLLLRSNLFRGLAASAATIGHFDLAKTFHRSMLADLDPSDWRERAVHLMGLTEIACCLGRLDEAGEINLETMSIAPDDSDEHVAALQYQLRIDAQNDDYEALRQHSGPALETALKRRPHYAAQPMARMTLAACALEDDRPDDVFPHIFCIISVAETLEAHEAKTLTALIEHIGATHSLDAVLRRARDFKSDVDFHKKVERYFS